MSEAGRYSRREAPEAMGPEFHPARIALSFSLVGPVAAYFIG